MLITGIIINNQYWYSYSTNEQSAKLFVFFLIFKKIIIRIIYKLNSYRFSLKIRTFAKLILSFIQKHNSNLDIYIYHYIYIYFFRKYSIREIVWCLKVIWFFKEWAFFNKVCILKIQVIYNCEIYVKYIWYMNTCLQYFDF